MGQLIMSQHSKAKQCRMLGEEGRQVTTHYLGTLLEEKESLWTAPVIKYFMGGFIPENAFAM